MAPEETRGQALFAAYRQTWEHLDRVTWQLPVVLLVIVLIAGIALPLSGSYGGAALGLALRWGLLGITVLAGALQQFRYLRQLEQVEGKLAEFEEQLVPMLLAPGHFSRSHEPTDTALAARLRQPKWLWGYLLAATSVVYLLGGLIMLMRWLAWAL